MFYFNRIILAGKVLENPEIRYTRKGSVVCLFSLWLKETGMKELEGVKNEFKIPIIAIGSGEEFTKVINKGDNLFVEGSLLKRIWEKEGFLKEETVVLAKKIITIKGGKNVEPEKSR